MQRSRVRDERYIEAITMTPMGPFPIPKLGCALLLPGKETPALGSSGRMELAFELRFDVYILEDSQLAAQKKNANDVWDHEIACHVIFVSQWVSLSLGRIEKKWQKEMKNDPEKAMQNAERRFNSVAKRAGMLSEALFDIEVTGIVELIYRYWEGINSDWIPIERGSFYSLGPSCPR